MLTASAMLPLGTKAPYFKLQDTLSDKWYTFQELRGKQGTLVMFICNHCPFVKHIVQEIVNLANDYANQEIKCIAISSNDVENFPEDAPLLMKATATQYGFPFPYLYDESQEVAQACQATCTPDFYLFDDKDTLVYRGQLDDTRPEKGVPPTGADIRNALKNLLAGKPIDAVQKPSIGCNIKWKKS